jgi:hypothetical protein
MKDVLVFVLSLISGLALFGFACFILAEILFKLAIRLASVAGHRRETGTEAVPSLLSTAALPLGMGVCCFVGYHILSTNVMSDRDALKIAWICLMAAMLWACLWTKCIAGYPGQGISRPRKRSVRPPDPFQ